MRQNPTLAPAPHFRTAGSPTPPARHLPPLPDPYLLPSWLAGESLPVSQSSNAPAIREVCKERGLHSKGTKRELLLRLKDQVRRGRWERMD